MRTAALVLALATPAPFAVLAGGGCGARDADLVGISPPRAAERAALHATDAASPLPADFRAHLSHVSDRFLSEGHGNGFDAVVWSNQAGRAGLDDGDYADGAMLVEELFRRGASDGGDAEGLLVMEKRGDGWRFVAVGPDGDVAADARGAACAECHREAPRDFVFRTPTAPVPRQSSSADASAATTTIAPTTVAMPAATYDARSAGSADAPSRR
jgi:hypothetical protein